MYRRHYYLLALVFLGGVLALDLSFLLHPDRLERLIDAELSKNLKVDYRYDELGFDGRAIIVEKLELSRPKNPDQLALSCERVGVTLDLGALFSGELKVKRIAIEQPVVYLRWNDQGDLDLASLVKSSDTKSRAPTIPVLDITGLQLKFINAPFFDDARDINIGHVDLELTPRFSDAFSYSFSGKVKDETFGRLDIEGTFGAALFRGAVRCQGFRITPELIGLFRKDLRQALEPIRMSGGLDLKLDVDSQELLQGVDLRLTATTKGLGLGWGNSPDLVEGLEGTFVFEGQRFESKHLQFKLCGAPVRVTDFRVDFPHKIGSLNVVTGNDGLVVDEPTFFARALVEDLWLSEEFGKSLLELPDPFPEIGETIIALGCEGKIVLDCTLSRDPKKQRDPAQRRVAIDCAIDFQETTMAWRGYADDDTGLREGYPYPFTRLIGRLQLHNDGIFTVGEGLRSQAEDQDVVIKGRVDFGRQPLAYDVRVEAIELNLDGRIKAALSDDEKKIYDSFDPEGQIDFDLHVQRLASALDEDAQVRIEFGLHLDSAKPEVFPIDLVNVEGRVVLEEGRPISLRGITAEAATAKFSLGGELDFSDDGGDGDFKLEIGVEDLQADATFLNALRLPYPDVSNELTRYQLKGLFDVEATIDSNPAVANIFDLTLKGVDFRIPDLAEVPFENYRGKLRVVGERLDVVSGGFSAYGNQMEPSGWVTFGDDARWDLRVKGSRLTVDDRLMRFAASFSEEVAEFTNQFDASGHTGLDVRLRRSSVGELITTRVLPVGLSLRHRSKPLVIGNIHGILEIRGDALRLEELTSDLIGGRGPNPVPATVSLGQGSFTSMDGLHLKDIQIVGLPLGASTVSWAPAAVGEFLRDLAMEGHVDVSVEVLRFHEGRAVFKADIKPRLLRADVGFSLELNSGVLDLSSAVVTADGLEFMEGRFKRSHGKIQRFLFQKLAADFLFENGALSLSKIDTRLIGGRTNPKETRFKVQLGEVKTFDLGLRLADGDLSNLVKIFGGKANSLQGRANLVMGMSGQVGELDSYRGEARAKMRGDRLYDLPFFAPVFQLINFDFLTTPQRGSQRGEVVMSLGNRELTVESASFRGPGINLDGSGAIGFDGLCKLAFEPKAIKLLDSIPIVGDISDLVGGIIVDKVYVTGPIENPRASIGNYITDLLPSAPDSGRRPVIRPPREDKKSKTPPSSRPTPKLGPKSKSASKPRRP
ncbi:MAG: hypothetical protein V3W41_21545 [Planctomycetota bacterium]